MTLNTYKHEHKGVEEINWSRLGNLVKELAEKIHREYEPEVVVGIAKGGVIPAVFLSSAFLVDFFPIKLSSRNNEQVVHNEPVWYILPTEAIKDRRVLLVDDIIVSGRTFRMACEKLVDLGAKEIRTASLTAHKDSFSVDFVGLVTDAMIIFPWDREVIDECGKWSINSEYNQGMET